MSFYDEIINKYKGIEIAGFKITVLSGKGVIVEGHRGLYEISSEVIRFKLKRGSITINGQGLEIVEISDSEAHIKGIIMGVVL